MLGQRGAQQGRFVAAGYAYGKAFDMHHVECTEKVVDNSHLLKLRIVIMLSVN